MDTISKLNKNLRKKVLKAIDQGNVFRANEYSANLMVGNVMLIMLIILLVCLGLNEVGVFTVQKEAMRLVTAACIVFELPPIIVNRKLNGDAEWLKNTLLIDLTIECFLLAAVLGHNVTLVMVIPVVLSIRYYDEKLVLKIAAFSAIMFVIASTASAYVGIVNLNMLHLPAGTDIHVTDTLRNAIEDFPIDYTAYSYSLLQNEFLPKLLIYIVIATGCWFIAKRGREMILLQNDVSRKSERVNTELELATKIQVGMLPCIFPAFPEHQHLDVFATNKPAKEVGGDFYDYFNIDEDHVALVMADVSGKGVGAALFMTISKIVIKNQLQQGIPPAEAMTNANQQLCENNEADLFVTVWVAVYEVSTGKLTYVNAGHNPPVIRRQNGQCEYLKQKSGFVLAGMEGLKYTQVTIDLFPGDAILLYTDGVTEATNSRNELYGEPRLLEFLNNQPPAKADQTVAALLDDIMKFTGDAEQFDDITILKMNVLN